MKKQTATQYPLLKQMSAIHAPSGDEFPMTEFLLKYIKANKRNWAHKPKIYAGRNFQDNIILVFGKPTTAIFAHIDSIGFASRYDNELVKIGGPVTNSGIKLTGFSDGKKVNVTLVATEDKKTGAKKLSFKEKVKIERGTSLTFTPNWREDKEYVQCCYMDNRLGVWNALKVAETLKNGIIVFSTWEEHGGGSVEYLAKFIFEKYGVNKGLISDITWVTNGVQHGKGVAISMRDSLIPRQAFIRKIISLAKASKVPFQLEVENAGGSDAKELQHSAFPWDWCFIGAPESNVHSPDEKVHKKDIEAMVDLYKYLMKEL